MERELLEEPEEQPEQEQEQEQNDPSQGLLFVLASIAYNDPNFNSNMMYIMRNYIFILYKFTITYSYLSWNVAVGFTEEKETGENKEEVQAEKPDGEETEETKEAPSPQTEHKNLSQEEQAETGKSEVGQCLYTFLFH